MILTDQEIQSLTGFRRASAQARWLRRNGYRFTVNGLGKPVVAVAEFNRHMVGGRAPSQEPNFNALREH